MFWTFPIRINENSRSKMNQQNFKEKKNKLEKLKSDMCVRGMSIKKTKKELKKQQQTKNNKK